MNAKNLDKIWEEYEAKVVGIPDDEIPVIDLSPDELLPENIRKPYLDKVRDKRKAPKNTIVQKARRVYRKVQVFIHKSNKEKIINVPTTEKRGRIRVP